MPSSATSRVEAYAGVRPEDFGPPRGLQTFYIRLGTGAGYGRQFVPGSLPDDVLEWCLRSLEAERDRRARVRVTPPTVRLAGRRVAILPGGKAAQFALF